MKHPSTEPAGSTDTDRARRCEEAHDEGSRAAVRPLSEDQARRIPLSSSAGNEHGLELRQFRGGKPFIASFCPNPACREHRRGAEEDGKPEGRSVGGERVDAWVTPGRRRRGRRGEFERPRWYIRWGFYRNSCFGRIQRYRCLGCEVCFSEMSFSIDYQVKRRLDYRAVDLQVSEGSGVRAISRALAASTSSVENRLARLARSSLAVQARLDRELSHTEDLAFDGFRSFAVSQHAPCDITILVGDESEYLYYFDYAPLRRGGTMSAAQRRSRERFERLMRASKQAVQDSAARVYDYIVATTALPREEGATPRRLSSDRHYAYREAWAKHAAIRHLAARGWLQRELVSSRRIRDRHNPLRPVNYFDREIRKDMAEHRRETVCFARRPVSMLWRFAIYAARHNLHKRRRIRGNAHVGAAEVVGESHAVAAGVDAATVAGAQIRRVTERPFLSREKLSAFAELLWRAEIPTPPHARYAKLPAYALV